MSSDINGFLQSLGLNPLDPRTQELVRQFSQMIGTESIPQGGGAFPQSVSAQIQQFPNPPLPLSQPQQVSAPNSPSLLNRAVDVIGRIRNPQIRPGNSLPNTLLNIFAAVRNPVGFLQQREISKRDEQNQQFQQREEERRAKEFTSLEEERKAQTASVRASEQERLQKIKQEKEDFDRQIELRKDILSGNPQSALGRSLVNRLGQDDAALAVSDPDLFKTVNNMDVQISKLQAMEDKLQAQIDQFNSKIPTTLESAGIQEFVKTHGRLPNSEERKAIAKERPEKTTSLDTFQIQRIDLKPNNPYGVTSMNAFVDPKKPGLIKDLAGNPIDTQFIAGLGVVKETPQETRFAKSQQQTTEQKNTVSRANNIITVGDTTIKEIQRLRSKIGPLSGRIASIEIGVGNPDPEIRGLYTRLAFLASLHQKVFGSRGQKQLEEFKRAVGEINTNPDALIQSIKAIQSVSNDIISSSGVRNGQSNENPKTADEYLKSIGR